MGAGGAGVGGAGVGAGGAGVGVPPLHRETHSLLHASNADAGFCGQSARHAFSEPPGQSLGVGAGGAGVGGAGVGAGGAGVGVPPLHRETHSLLQASNADAGLCGHSARHAFSEPPGQSSNNEELVYSEVPDAAPREMLIKTRERTIVVWR